ncbi:heterokaryon incompatibility protein-domain-containing protein [Xylariales sp. PMI_506]|nr:heterokaryon incompatibility protein-domain-containing protein [Xylariales sp. PMI_506]
MARRQALRAEQPSSLCEACKQVDFSRVFLSERDALPDTGEPIVSVGKRLSKPACSLCRFFLSHGPEYGRNYGLHARLFSHVRHPPAALSSPPTPSSSSIRRSEARSATGVTEGHGVASIGETSLRRSRFLSVLRENSRLVYDHVVRNEMAQFGIITYVPDRRAAVAADDNDYDVPTSSIRVLETVTPDYDLLGSIIRHCAETHASCVHDNHLDSLPYVNLIDCLENRMVRTSPKERYLALSYVWGEPEIKTEGSRPVIDISRLEGFLCLDEIPLTVQDAMRVVRSLGRRYLWMDKYCIKQDQEDEKQLMIRNMNQIYEQAEATIVALRGNNDRAGLPGVSIVPRVPQLRFDLTGDDWSRLAPPSRL